MLSHCKESANWDGIYGNDAAFTRKDVVCQRALTQVVVAWQPFEDPETEVAKYLTYTNDVNTDMEFQDHNDCRLIGTSVEIHVPERSLSNVQEDDIVGTDLNYQSSVTSLSANWDGFGEPKNDDSGPVISKVSRIDATIGEHLKIEHYKVAVSTDRRFHNTRNNIRPFINRTSPDTFCRRFCDHPTICSFFASVLDSGSTWSAN
ncbi:hypothetical protein LSAT2_012839 [Lamellibrachia satsuma]|nr:hypothetical protein LSAT2_012839 [Lamellibrachia satsuma]